MKCLAADARLEEAEGLAEAIGVSVVAERLCIVVNNSSPQLQSDLWAADYGHGLSNVDLRLRAAYGNDARLTVGPDHQGGTSAFLDLPLRSFAGPPLPETARS